jgi:hypothetical protein
MHFVGIVMEMLLLLLKNFQAVSPTGKYFVLSVDNCKKEGCFPVRHCQLNVSRQNMDDDHSMKTVHCSPHISTWQTVPKLTAHILNSYYSNESPGYVQSHKVKLSLCLTNKAILYEGMGESGCIDPHFLDLSTSWRWVVTFTFRPLYPWGKSPRYLSDRRLGGPQSWSGDMEKKKFLTLLELELWLLSHPACSQSLYWLHYSGSRCKIMYKN